MEDAILRRHRFLPKESGGKKRGQRGVSIFPLFGFSLKNDQSEGSGPLLNVPPGVDGAHLSGSPYCQASQDRTATSSVPPTEAVTAGNAPRRERKDDGRR